MCWEGIPAFPHSRIPCHWISGPDLSEPPRSLSFFSLLIFSQVFLGRAIFILGLAGAVGGFAVCSSRSSSWPVSLYSPALINDFLDVNTSLLLHSEMKPSLLILSLA